MMTDEKAIIVADVPPDASQTEAEAILNEAIERGYYVLSIVSGGLNAGARAYFAKQRDKSKPANDDGRESEAIDFVRRYPKMSATDLSLRLRDVGINRGRSWVAGRQRLMMTNG